MTQNIHVIRHISIIETAVIYYCFLRCTARRHNVSVFPVLGVICSSAIERPFQVRWIVRSIPLCVPASVS